MTARGSDIFTYDQANRLKSATVTGESGTQTGTYVYNGDGNRASKTVGTTTTNYAYDVNASLPNVLTDGTLKYVYGLDLAYAVDSAGNVQVYHTDGLGSVRAITDIHGTLIQTYQTDEFGNPSQPPSSNSQPFQYTGQQSGWIECWRSADAHLCQRRYRQGDPILRFARPRKASSTPTRGRSSSFSTLSVAIRQPSRVGLRSSRQQATEPGGGREHSS